jgi:hypothetical protein
MEVCESGLIERLAKPCPQGPVGSNPTASATYKIKDFYVAGEEEVLT